MYTRIFLVSGMRLISPYKLSALRPYLWRSRAHNITHLVNCRLDQGHTCGGSASIGHYEIDTETYAHDWQVDYLKVDYCGPTAGNTTSDRISYQAGPQYDAWMELGKALNNTGRPIYYSICPHRHISSSDGFPRG